MLIIVPLTVMHTPAECNNFKTYKMFTIPFLEHLFESTVSHITINLIKETHFYSVL